MSIAGRLRTRLTLEEPVEVPDGQGGVTRSYQTLATLWASLEALRGRADIRADALGVSITHRIIIRSGAILSVQHRLRLGERLFVIEAYRAARDGALIEIDAVEIAP